MADRNLEVRLRVKNQRAFNADLKKSEKGVRALGSSTGRAALRAKAGSKAFGGLTSALRGVGRGGLYAVGGLAAVGGVLGKRSIAEWREAEKVMRGTEQRIRTTGGAANVTAQQVGGLAQAISFRAGIDDEEIQRAGNLLLTFRAIKNEGKGKNIFSEAMRTAIDMSAAYDQSVRSTTIQLGKALQEPAKMATALKRTGAVSNADVERLQAMDEAGASLLEQQKELLKLVNKAGVKGAAAAEADQVMRLQVAWSNTEEAIGRVIGPPAMRLAGKFASHLERQIIPEIENLASGFNEIWDPSENRSMATNMKLSRSLLRRELGPVWGDVKTDIERANLDDKLLAQFSNAVPRIAETMGQGAGQAGLAFLKGLKEAPVWAQLLTAFWVAGKLNGARFALGFGTTAGPGIAASTAAGGAIGGALGGAGAMGRLTAYGAAGGGAFGSAFGIAAATGIAFYLDKNLHGELEKLGFAGDWLQAIKDFHPFNPAGRLKHLDDLVDAVTPNAKGVGDKAASRVPNLGAGRHPDNNRGTGRRRKPKRLTPFTGGPVGGSSVFSPVITVQSVLDGKVIAESTGRYAGDRKARR